MDGRKYQPGNACVHRQQGPFLSVYVDDTRLAGKQNLDLMWKKWMKHDELGEPTSFLDHVCLGCNQRDSQPNERVVDEDRKMFESRISAGENEKLLESEKMGTNVASWSYDMEGLRRNALTGTAN